MQTNTTYVWEADATNFIPLKRLTDQRDNAVISTAVVESTCLDETDTPVAGVPDPVPMPAGVVAGSYFGVVPVNTLTPGSYYHGRITATWVSGGDTYERGFDWTAYVKQ